MRAFFIFLSLFFSFSCFAVFDKKQKEEKQQDVALVGSLSVLPNEMIIIQIFPHLGTLDLARFSQTSSFWLIFSIPVLKERLRSRGTFTYDGRGEYNVFFPPFLFSSSVTTLHLSHLSAVQARQLNRIFNSESSSIFLEKITDLAIEESDLGDVAFLPNAHFPNLVRLTVAGNYAASGILEEFIRGLLTSANALRLTYLNLANQPTDNNVLLEFINRSHNPPMALVELNIARNRFANAQEITGLVRTMSRSPNLVCLNMEELDIYPYFLYHFLDDMHAAVGDNAPLFSRLVSLNLAHCPLGLTAFSLRPFLSLQRGFYRALEHLNFSGNELGPDKIIWLLSFLIDDERFPALRELYLGGNNAGEDGAVVLRESIQTHRFTNLIVLDFSSNNAGEALKELMRSIRRATMPNLVELNIANNGVDASVIGRIIEDVARAPQMNQTLPESLRLQNIHYENGNEQGFFGGVLRSIFMPFASYF